MKKLAQIGTWFLILAAIGWATGRAQEATDSTLPPVTIQSLGLSGTNISTLGSLSDQQLSVVVNALNATPTISPANLPQSGTFWSLENPDQPPFPTDLIGAAAWELSAPDGGFLLDDRNVTANVTTKGARESRATKGSGEFEAALSGPPSPPGGGSGSTNLTNAKGAGTGVNYGTNLFLTKVVATNGWFAALASNTVPGVAYTIQWETNLLANNWQSAGEIVGSGLTNWTLWNFPQGNWTNLFVRLRSEISTDGSGIPDWWEEMYFGTNTVNPDAQDPAGDGYTIYQKYELGVPPGQFLTPPAPAGFTVVYNSVAGTATLTWQPSLGAVTRYVVVSSDAGIFYPPATTNRMVDTSPVISFIPEFGEPSYTITA